MRTDESTSNLLRHVEKCEPQNSAQTRAITTYAHGSTYHPAKHRLSLALWVSRRARPYAIVEDAELREIFYNLNSNVKTPSASTVSRDVREIFKMSRVKVGDLLKVNFILCYGSIYLSLIYCIGIQWETTSLCRRLDLTTSPCVSWDNCTLDSRRTDDLDHLRFRQVRSFIIFVQNHTNIIYYQGIEGSYRYLPGGPRCRVPTRVWYPR